MSSTALPTAQVNGVVWTQAVVNGIDYVGGSFSQSQPAGAADGVSVTSRANLFAYDVQTGIALPGFNATTNAQVRGIAASPDGSRIYIVGDFTQVNGQARNHIAALDASGNLVAGFAPNVNGNVYAVATRGDSVFFGGSFSAVTGVARSRAAAVSSSGSVLAFAPNVLDYVVRAVAISADSSKVLLGGSFSQTNGVDTRGLAAVDAISGVSLPWAANQVITNSGQNSAIYSLSTRGTVVYATGYVYGGDWNGNLEGAIAMNWSDGSAKWIEDCHGDTYSSFPFNDALYTASHAHECRTVVGGFEQSDPVVYHRALAFSQAATGTLLHNTIPNYLDFGGYPSPTLASWSPSFNTGTYTGLIQGPWSVSAGGSYVVYGGEFTKVNGARQTGLVRFLGQSESPDTGITTPTPTPTPTPTATPISNPESSAPHRVAKPDAVSLSTTRIGVKWKATSSAKADKVTGYIVSAVKGSKTVVHKTVSTRTRTAVLAGLKKGTTYRVTVTAKNAAGNAKPSVADLVKTKKSGSAVSSTKKPGKVSKPAVKSRGAHSVRISWKAASVKGATPVRHYLVRLYEGRRLVKTVTTSASARSLTIKSLEAHTGYTVAVAAASWAGTGPRSVATAATTRR